VFRPLSGDIFQYLPTTQFSYPAVSKIQHYRCQKATKEKKGRGGQGEKRRKEIHV